MGGGGGGGGHREDTETEKVERHPNRQGGGDTKKTEAKYLCYSLAFTIVSVCAYKLLVLQQPEPNLYYY